MKKGRILSGMRPTGKLDLGNLEGALRNWVRLQDDYECFYEVADWHALTTGFENTSAIQSNISDMVLDWLSVGMDPHKSTIFIQSHVPEHAELHLLLSMLVPVPWLERNPTYKEWLTQGYDATYGLLGYPVLQAADILIYKADTVPVGKDQLPHLELAREIARRFNYFYGEVFPEPQALVAEEAAVVPGLDGRKMSKSYGNQILLTEKPEEIKRKVSTMFTDPQKIHLSDPGHPETCPVFALHRLYNAEETAEISEKCKGGKLGCVADKERLAQKIIEALTPIQEKRKELETNPKFIREIIVSGTEKARAVAQQTIREVRAAMKL